MINLPSPRATLGGCMWLPRIIAKARLLESGALPAEYADRFCHPTGVDAQFLRFFELNRRTLKEPPAERMSRSVHGSASCRLPVPRSFHSGTRSRQIWVVPAFPWRSASRSHSPQPTNTWNPQNSVLCSRSSKPMKPRRRCRMRREVSSKNFALVQISGERARPACHFRRLAGKRCSAGRPTPHARTRMLPRTIERLQ
jgi:hypothetical protein